MSTIPSLIRADIVAACRDSTVATVAGLGAAAWADTVVPHVFDGLQGMMGGRNRGRLPFLEIACNDLNYDTHHTEGGVVETMVSIRCHVGSRDQVTAIDSTAAILMACLAKIRDRSTVTYLTDGTEQLQAIVAGPWGLMRECQLTIRHTFLRSNYGGN